MDIMDKSIQDPDVKDRLTYSNGRLALVDRLEEVNTDYAVRLDGVFIILCVAGKMSLHISGNVYEAHPNDIIISMPQAIIGRVQMSDDFEFRCMFMSSEFAFKMLPMSAQGWSLRMFLERYPKLTLTSAEVKVFCRYCELLKSKFADRYNKYRDKVLDSLMLAFAYDFASVLDRFVPLIKRPLTSAENIFSMFISIISSSYPKRRNVAFYADRLNITPKYLSVVCRKSCGRTASKIIDAYVIKDVEFLLKTTRKSIKEISNELEFPNTSFFGRFVKKYLGVTPNEYRRKNQ